MDGVIDDGGKGQSPKKQPSGMDAQLIERNKDKKKNREGRRKWKGKGKKIIKLENEQLTDMIDYCSLFFFSSFLGGGTLEFSFF